MRGPSVLLGRSASVLALTAGASCRRRQCRSSVGPSRHPSRRGTSSRRETCSPGRPGLDSSAASRHRRSGLNFFVRQAGAAQQFRIYVCGSHMAKTQVVEGVACQAKLGVKTGSARWEAPHGKPRECRYLLCPRESGTRCGNGCTGGCAPPGKSRSGTAVRAWGAPAAHARSRKSQSDTLGRGWVINGDIVVDVAQPELRFGSPGYLRHCRIRWAISSSGTTRRASESARPRSTITLNASSRTSSSCELSSGCCCNKRTRSSLGVATSGL